ncbi:SH2 domain-containing protein 7 [Astyanax mexicanus]|uniref:SH2 domain-containing protein 7 n=1 Tax=Astyanax mexicanus TaxID=7994 RepID=UPI0020CB63B0|nr:SH2 domain-containing protein 7 [Astyanax mexicanus]
MSAMYIRPVTVCTPSQRLFFPLKQLKRTSAFSNMRLRSYHMQQHSATGTLWHNPQCLGQRSVKSQLSYLTGRHLMEQKRPKTHRFQSCLMFCLKESVRMEHKRPGGADSPLETTESKLRELALKWFTETQAPLILHEGNFPAWFQGFISRKDAEDHLRDKEVGCFLIRLSDKATGYILSYKGRERCRHFVINQNKEGQFIVTGDTEMHDTLTSLIQYYKTRPIEPYGEYLTMSCFESSTSDLYDVVQFEPKEKPRVNVKAAKHLWDQRAEHPPSQHQQPPTVPFRNSRPIQAVPPVPKRCSPPKMKSLEEKSSSGSKVLYAQLEKLKPKDRDSEFKALAQRSAAPGSGTVYSELSLSDCRSRSLPLLDDNTQEDHSYRLNTPSPSPPQLSPNLQRQDARKSPSQAPPSHSHSLDKLCDNNSFYQLAGKPSNLRDPKQAVPVKTQQDTDVTYAEVPLDPMLNRFRKEENMYEQIPEPRHTPITKGSSAQGSSGNTYETLEDCKPKSNESTWGLKADKWKWLLPEHWKK